MITRVKHCWLLDFDRTISSVDIVMEAVEHVCDKLGLDYQKVRTQKELTEAGGHSFSVPTVVMSLWPEQYDAFCAELKVVEHLNSIYPDATEFMQILNKTNQTFVIITYGDPDWQLLKMHFAGLDSVPHIICDIPEKNVLLEQLRTDNGFELHTSEGIITTATITLVDDKPAAFETPCNGVSGILIERRDRHVLVPPNVQLITSFNELIGSL